MTREGNPCVGAQPGEPAALKTGLQGRGRGGEKPDSLPEPDPEYPLYSPLVAWLLTHHWRSLSFKTRRGQTSPGRWCSLPPCQACLLILILACGRPEAPLWPDSGFHVSGVDPGPSSEVLPDRVLMGIKCVLIKVLRTLPGITLAPRMMLLP